MKISLGPILYYWPRQRVQDFYRQALAAPVDIIYLGETVCAKRQELRPQEWLELAAELADSGREIVLSTLSLIESRAELATLKKLCDNSGCLLEANDMAAVQLLSERRLPFVTGPAINIYNARSLLKLWQRGLRRWVMPVELSGVTLEAILQEVGTLGFGDKVETEVFSYGRLPLAYSARCFTARAKDLPKDNCQLSCLDFPDGIPVVTQENHPLFQLNGIQTQSAQVYNLLDQCHRMAGLGVDVSRISPTGEETFTMVQAFHQSLNGEPQNTQLIAREHCNGYWHGAAGMNHCRF